MLGRLLRTGLVLFVACGEPTEIVVVIHSDIADELDEVELLASHSSGTLQQSRIPVSAGVFPLTHAVAFTDDGISAITLEAVGYRAGQPVIRDLVQAQFVEAEIREVHLELNEVCLGVACSDDDEACVYGNCEQKLLQGSEQLMWTGSPSPAEPYCEELDEDGVPGPDEGFVLDNHCMGCGSPCAPATFCAADNTCYASPVVEVSVGSSHACARHQDGVVTCWGYSWFGQTGQYVAFDEDEGFFARARAVQGVPRTVMSIAAGGNDSCAITQSGVVHCWGLHFDDIPIEPRADLQNVRSISLNYEHRCFLGSDGRARCVGVNNASMVGGMAPEVGIPIEVPIGEATAIATGLMHSCAIDASSTVHCWGSNANAQLGPMGSMGGPDPVPVLSGASQLALGEDYSCALMTDGSVQCWGDNRVGQLGREGDGGPMPAPVPGIAGATMIASSWNHVCVLIGTRVVCWGWNTTGQLGVDPELFPVVGPTDLYDSATNISAGTDTTCVVTTPGGVRCWGSRAFGGLGDWSIDSDSVSFTGVDVIDP